MSGTIMAADGSDLSYKIDIVNRIGFPLKLNLEGCWAQVQQAMRNPNQQREIHQRSTQKTRTNKQKRKPNTIFNEI